MTTYIVRLDGNDSNSGTVDSAAGAFLTPAKLISSLTQPGDIGLFGDGDWGGVIYSAIIANGTQSNPITLKSKNKWGAKIKVIGTQGSGSGHNSPLTCALEIQADYWVIDGFEIDGSAGYSGNNWIGSGIEWGIGIYLTGSFSIAQNCKIHDLAKSTTATSNGGGGIVHEYYYESGNANGQQSLNNTIYNIGTSLRNNTVHGIYIASPNSKAKGNTIYNCASVGIQGWHKADTLEYFNNVVFNCKQGLLIGSGSSGAVTGGIHNCRVANNIVVHCDTTGIDEEGTIGSGNLYSNNLSWSNGTNWALISGTQSNSLNVDPLFKNYQPDGSGDYSLTSNSPCINAGIMSLGTSPTAYAPTIDSLGVVRPQGYTIDIGALELVVPAPSPTPTPTPAPTTSSPLNYPFGAIPIMSSQLGSNSVMTAKFPGSPGKTNYITSFEITGGGAQYAKIIYATLSGIIGGSASYIIGVKEGPNYLSEPLIIKFPNDIPASAVNSDITLTVPAFGYGNVASAVVMHGYQL